MDGEERTRERVCKSESKTERERKTVLENAHASENESGVQRGI